MKVSGWIENIIKYVCVVLMLEMVAICFLQVVTRYGFNFTYKWVEEMAIWSMVWMIYLGSALGAITNQHPRIDALLNALPSRAKNLLESFDCLVCAGIAAVLAYHSIGVIQFSGGICSTGMGASFSIFFASLLAGGGLMALFFCIRAAGYIKLAFGKGDSI